MFWLTWIEGDMWTPRDWTVFNRSTRTNNSVEGWHSRLNRKAFKANLPFYSLVRLLYNESQCNRITQGFLQAGRYPATQFRKERYRILDRLIRRYWREFSARKFSSFVLLEKCSKLYSRPFRRA